MDAFEKLNNKFNTESFETKLTEVNNQLETVKQKKNEIANTINDTQVILTKEDQNYLIDEIKDSIEQVDIVLKNVALDTRIGTPATVLEAYSKILNAKSILIRELREIYKTIMDMQLFNPDSSINKAKNEAEGIKMSHADIVALIRAADQSSETNRIDAKFEIVDREESNIGSKENLFKDSPLDKK